MLFDINKLREYPLRTKKFSLRLYHQNLDMSKKTFTLSSNDLGGNFTDEFVMDGNGCSGGNKSPHLAWKNAPEGAKSFAVFMHDPDAPTASGFWHWAVYNIPKDIDELPSGAGSTNQDLLPEGAVMGTNDTGQAQYNGPCPPKGDFTHRYIITVYALGEEKLDIDENTPIALAEFMMVTGPMLGKASIICHYKH